VLAEFVDKLPLNYYRAIEACLLHQRSYQAHMLLWSHLRFLPQEGLEAEFDVQNNYRIV